jgi:hypothetical protein
VNTGVQTSTRMWYETIKNWITELLNVNSSELNISTPTDVRVEEWVDRVNSTATELTPLNFYDINSHYMPMAIYDILISNQNTLFSQAIIDGVQHYALILNSEIFSVNPELMNYFI